ncbi:MAG: EamA family transporter [Gammaproteobacteria bacterium]|nr:EamA family transporter [Gammaproteobacteria bacterium]
MYWLIITLCCALALAASDVVAKKTLAHLDIRSLTVIRLGLAGLLMIPLAFSAPLPDLPWDFWLWMAILVPCEIAAMYFYMKAIRDYPLSMTVPYLSFTPVFAIFTAWLLLGEQISVNGFIGIILILTGAWLLNVPEIGKISLRKIFEPLKIIFINAGSRFMLLAATIYSLTASGGKYIMAYMPASQFGSFYFSIVGLTAILVFGKSSALPIRRNLIPSFFVAALMAIMVYLHFLALEQVEVAYMISVKRTSVLFGIIFGVIFFRERHLAMHLFAASLMLVGVFVIAFL